MLFYDHACLFVLVQHWPRHCNVLGGPPLGGVGSSIFYEFMLGMLGVPRGALRGSLTSSCYSSRSGDGHGSLHLHLPSSSVVLWGLGPMPYLPNVRNCIVYRVFSTPVAWPVVTMETVGQTNPVRHDGMVWALSAHYIMLIKPQQALPLVRIY